MTKHRILGHAEFTPDGRSVKGSFYVFGIDVGRHKAQTVLTVIKVSENKLTGAWDKKLVNIFVYEDAHFEEQAGQIKEMFSIFRPQAIAIDGTGLGTGLIDYLVKWTEYNGIQYEPFGVISEKHEEDYKQFLVPESIPVLYIIKADPATNSAMHSNIYAQLVGGRMKFLIDERTAKTRFAGQEGWNNRPIEERARKLKPFTLTSILKEEMLNLRREGEGADIRLKRVHTKIGKDKFSALENGMYYIYLKERERKKRFNIRAENAVKATKKPKRSWKRW